MLRPASEHLVCSRRHLGVNAPAFELAISLANDVVVNARHTGEHLLFPRVLLRDKRLFNHSLWGTGKEG
jgi:hypothetical protein